MTEETRQQTPETPETPEAPRPPAKDPMKSFRGVQAGTLVLEVIVLGLALPVVAHLGNGITSIQGWSIIAIAAVLLACCALLRKLWVPRLILGVHAGLLAFVVALPAVAIIGALFAAIWLWLMWMRRDVERRMAQGRLPSQQV